MVSLTLTCIIFTVIQRNVASKYYYKKIDETYDVYYGPRAIWGYKEFKPPKSFKSDFEDRGDRPGQCIQGEFACEEPYRAEETQIFECEVDYQCPRYFKCCQLNCFQHKICQPAVTEENKEVAELNIVTLPTVTESSTTSSSQSTHTTRTTTSSTDASTTTATPFATAKLRVTTLKTERPITFESRRPSESHSTEFTSTESTTTALLALLTSPSSILENIVSNTTHELTESLSTQPTPLSLLSTTYITTSNTTQILKKTSTSTTTSSSSSNPSTTTVRFSGITTSDRLSATSTSRTNKSMELTTQIPLKTTKKFGVTNTPAVKSTASGSTEEEIKMTDITSDDEDLVFSGDYESTSGDIGTVSHKSSGGTTILASTSIQSISTTSTEKITGRLVNVTSEEDLTFSEGYESNNIITKPTVAVTGTTELMTSSITSEPYTVIFVPTVTESPTKRTKEHENVSTIKTISFTFPTQEFSTVEPSRVSPANILNATQRLQGTSTIHTVSSPHSTLPSKQNYVTFIYTTSDDEDLVFSGDYDLTSTSDKHLTESTRLISNSVLTSSTELATLAVKSLESSTMSGSSYNGENKMSSTSSETSVTYNNTTYATDVSTKKLNSVTTDDEDLTYSGDGTDVTVVNKDITTDDEDLIYSGDGTGTIISELLQKYSTTEDGDLTSSGDDILDTDTDNEVTRRPISEIQSTKSISTSTLSKANDNVMATSTAEVSTRMTPLESRSTGDSMQNITTKSYTLGTSEEIYKTTVTKYPTTKAGPSTGVVKEPASLKSSVFYTDTSKIVSKLSSSMVPTKFTSVTLSTKEKTPTFPIETPPDIFLKTSTHLPTSIRTGTDTKIIDSLEYVPYDRKMPFVNNLLGVLRKVPITIQKTGSDNTDQYFYTFLEFLGKIPSVVESARIKNVDYFKESESTSKTTDYEIEPDTLIKMSADSFVNDQSLPDHIFDRSKQNVSHEVIDSREDINNVTNFSLSGTIEEELLITRPSTTFPTKVSATDEIERDKLSSAPCSIEESSCEGTHKVTNEREAEKPLVRLL